MTLSRRSTPALDPNPLWYQDAIIYQAHVKSFYDSDGDGIGDFRGMTDKLDYLQDLGVTALWILPFYPSPLRDDGYDTAQYTGVHPSYGTLADFHVFLRELHRRGIRLITELVLNHTSDQHEWFQRARTAPPGSRWRNFYVWSDTAEKYREARIIFKDFEASNWSWDPEAHAYYWHRFYSHQPDLNFESPDVRRSMLRVVDFWMRQGVDGLRLDAVPYLYEQDGTTCENLPQTHGFLKELRRHIDERFADRMLLAEANQWPEDAAAYFGDGDECHMAFHFPVMPRLFIALYQENRFPIVDILQQTPSIPANAQWAVFLRNHDELTLEMVTDEERDYAYRVYASDAQARINLGIRRRLAPLLGNNRRRIELLNGLLFSLPGTPVLYYGDELGMGDNIYLGDRNGVRTPMQWSADRNAGFSRANPQRLYLPVIIDPEYHFEAVNVEAANNNPSSLLWWMKRLIALRKRYLALGRGNLQMLRVNNPKVLAFVRTYGDEQVLVVANLSRFAQPVELDLRAFAGIAPVELFGQTRFPQIGDLPYLLTMGPHSFYWMDVTRTREQIDVATTPTLPTVPLAGRWDSLLTGQDRDRLEAVLPAYLRRQAWVVGRHRSVRSAQIATAVRLGRSSRSPWIALVDVMFGDGVAERYHLPLGYATGEAAERLVREQPTACVTTTKERDALGVIYDACYDPAFGHHLVRAIASKHQFEGLAGRVQGTLLAPQSALRAAMGDVAELRPGDFHNTVLSFGENVVLKVMRRVGGGEDPEMELGRVLSHSPLDAPAAPLLGALEYVDRRGRRGASTLAVVHGCIPQSVTAWQHATDALGRYFELALARADALPLVQAEDRNPPPLLELAGRTPPPLVEETIGAYLADARLLGRRTAGLHLALANIVGSPAFAPEPLTSLYQRSLYQSLRNLAARSLTLLRGAVDRLPATERELAADVLQLEPQVLARFQVVTQAALGGLRIRGHGDYHLGQLLYTGRDYVVIDFEGEAERSLDDRRSKRSPLRDVAGMVRSFYYAAHSAFTGQNAAGLIRDTDVETLRLWARFWYRWVSAAFLGAYLEAVAGSGLLPSDPRQLAGFLDVLLLERAVHELGFELEQRPQMMALPLQAIKELLAAP